MSEVRGSRGQAVHLEPHHDAVRSSADLDRFLSTTSGPLAMDLFCGAGGLSLGLERAGMTVTVGIDHDEYAIATHRANHPGLSEAWDLYDPQVVRGLGELVSKHEFTLVCGGPPCQPFSRAGRGIIRSLVDRGIRGEVDARRDLWQAFLEVVRLGRPRAVLMENVPDMAFDRGMVIIRSVLSALESWGYSASARILDASEHGVPQMRRRLFVVGLRDRASFEWPDQAKERVSLISALGDLPEIEGGWNHSGLDEMGGMDYLPAATSYQHLMRAGCGKTVFDHVTRAVREDDRRAFASMDPGTKYSELDDDLKRYRDDIFKDKYNRLDPNAVSRTVTAHLSRDGYAYIHPFEDRTISVREAARIQSFPDSVRFAGPPTAAFRQIGNAVPVLLGEALGHSILSSIEANTTSNWSISESTRTLSDYFVEMRDRDELCIPWLASTTTWQLIACTHLLKGLGARESKIIWNLVKSIETADLAIERREIFSRVGRQLGISSRMDELLEFAERIISDEDPASFLNSKIWDQVCTLSDSEEEALVATPPMIRVAARIFNKDESTLSASTTARLLVAHLVGGLGDNMNAAFAARGLLNLAASHCTASDPSCKGCPLEDRCESAGQQTEQLRLT